MILRVIIACHFSQIAAREMRSYIEKCDSKLPNLSVGDVWLDDQNYMKFKKKHKLFILGVSDSTCDKGVCCHSETVLNSL